MSRQTNKHNVTLGLFIILVASIGFPFQSLDFSGFEISLPTGVEIQSDLQIVNLFLGKGSVGKSIFDANTYANNNQLAYGLVNDTKTFFDDATYGMPPDPMENVSIGRSAESETIQIGDRKFETSTKPAWIQNNEGDWVERIVTDDVDGVMFESAKYTYYYDKSACGMSVYDGGRLIAGEPTIVKYDGWVVKSALNGTDNWIDLSQNSLPCVVEVINNEQETKIISTRGDVDGVFTENYVIGKPLEEMKTTVTFWNNNTSLNNHKIAFSNVLDEVPNNFRFSLNHQEIIPAGNYTAGELDGTTVQYYNANTLQMENYTITDYSYPETVINTNKLTEFTTNMGTIPKEYNADDVVLIDNEYNISIDDLYVGAETGFTMDYWSEDKQTTIPLKYDFINDSMDKLWNVKIVNNFDGNHVYVDYMNTEEIISVGETATLDPATSLGLVYVVVTTHATVGTDGNIGCKQQDNNLGFDNNMRWEHHLNGGTFPNQNESNGCVIPVSQIDITSIPDEASVLQLDFGINATSFLCSSSYPNNCTFGATVFPKFWWAMGNAEQVLSLDGKQVGATVMPFTDGVTENLDLFIFDSEVIPYPPTLWVNEPDGLGTFGCSPTDCRFEITPRVDPDPATDQFEEFLESGKNYVIWSGCHIAGSGSLNAGCGYGKQAGGNSPAFNIQHEIYYDSTTFDLTITWEIFSLATSPQSLTCESVGSDLFLDWESPLDDGGTTITGYKIERSTGFGYSLIEALSPSVPTSYTDTSGVIAGVSYTYRVSTVNDVGVGGFAEISCGLAGTSNAIIDLQATNQALGVVALDWTEPSFTGNTPITGYQIQRTEGTPSTDDTWTYTTQQNANNYHSNSISQNLDNIVMSYGGGTGMMWLYKVFDADDIDGRDIILDWATGGQGQGKRIAVRILDGSYSNVDFATDFPPTPSCTNCGDYNPTIKFNGVLNNYLALTGGGGTDVSFDITETVLTADTSNSISTDNSVTLFIKFQDRVYSTGTSGSLSIDSIEVEGLGAWEFGTNSFAELNPNTPVICQAFDNEFSGGALVQMPCGEIEGNLAIGDGFITLVPDTGNTNVEYLDNTVTELTQYGYRVFAINSQGLSPSSNVAVITTSGAPNAPVITATPTGTTSINIDWVEPDLGGATLVGYEIERKVGVSGIFSNLATVTPTEYDDGTGLFKLQSATEYCYRVKTITNVGESAFSTEQCATTFDAPSEPVNLLVTALDGSSVNMSFDTPLSDGGSPITGYKIERQIGAGSFVVLDPLTPIQFRNDTGLPIGTLITYRVSASNAFGFGDTATASDTTDATPQVPQNLVCSASTPDSINLSWATPLTFSPPTGYQISRNIDGGAFSVLVADTASTGTTYNDVTLSLDTIYGYKILAHTSEGDTLLTDPVYCQTLKQPDSPPENFKAEFSQTIPHDVILTWDLPNTFGVPITSITVERDDGAGYVEIAVLPPNAVGMVDTEPDNDVDQKYRIKMTGSLGDSKYGYAIPSDLNRVSHFNFEKTISDSGDQKNSATVSGIINFAETGHAGTRAFDYDGASYIIVDVAQESDYDFERTTPFGGSLYYKGSASLLALDDNWYATNHKFCNLGSGQNGCDYQPFALSTNANGYNAVGTTGGSVPSVNDAYQKRGESILFKTFDKSDLDGKTLHIDWNGFNFGTGAGTCTGIQTVGIYDGEYSIADGGVADFPDGSPIVMKGAGLLQTLNTQSCILGVGGNWSFDGVSATIDLSSATDPSNKVTLMFIVQDNDSSNNTNTFAPYFIVTDLTLIGTTAINERIWDFTSTLGATYTEDNPTTCIRDCGLTQSTEIGLLGLQALLTKAQTLASIGWAFYLDEGYPVFRMNGATQSIEVKSDQFVTTDNLEHLAFTTNGNSTGAGVEIFVNGTVTGKTIVTDTLTSESILNNEPLVIGATSTGTNILQSITDEIMIFSEDLDDGEITEIANDQIETVAPINATMTLTGSTFANISSEEPEITLISGFPLPNISGNLELKNFTTTTVNSASGLSIPASGVLNVPALFNQMGSLSNYTAIATLDNGLEVFVVISNEDLQSPLFTLPAGIEFFFQQQRINNFENLSFNFTKTSIPFDLACNLKSELFEEGVTIPYEDVGFIQAIWEVPRNKDVVVACIDQNSPLLNPDEPSFGGSNALLTFVSFGDTTGIGAFLNFTDNYGDFFGAPLPYLFIILAAALFTGRSAPTGIIVIGIALGIMWYLGILVIDPVLWGIIVVLVILGAIGGKKFL